MLNLDRRTRSWPSSAGVLCSDCTISRKRSRTRRSSWARWSYRSNNWWSRWSKSKKSSRAIAPFSKCKPKSTISIITTRIRIHNMIHTRTLRGEKTHWLAPRNPQTHIHCQSLPANLTSRVKRASRRIHYQRTAPSQLNQNHQRCSQWRVRPSFRSHSSRKRCQRFPRELERGPLAQWEHRKPSRNWRTRQDRTLCTSKQRPSSSMRQPTSSKLHVNQIRRIAAHSRPRVPSAAKRAK
jgi:hypothetical protein